jgi:NTP pyrophosphatase (non-canonical NTP hydrolase)
MKLVDSDALTLTEVVTEAYDNSKAHGFYDLSTAIKDYHLASRHPDYDFLVSYKRTEVAEKLALIHSEVSEALEGLREGHTMTSVNANGKPEGLPSELADVVIRVADLCGLLGIDLNNEVNLKMKYNRSRPYKHGKAL